MREFSKDSYMKLISHITYFVMRNQGVRRIILYRTLFKLTFAQKTKVIDSNYGRANTNFSHLGKECTGYQTYRSAFHSMSPNLKWNVDMEDWEKVLRIECQGITPTEISKALRAINIYAQELE